LATVIGGPAVGSHRRRSALGKDNRQALSDEQQQWVETLKSEPTKLDR
jgi:hypothetical protein